MRFKEFERLAVNLSKGSYYAFVVLDAWTWAAKGWVPKVVLYMWAWEYMYLCCCENNC